MTNPRTDKRLTICELLLRNGFLVHGHRADCAKCTGSSRLTVSFNAEVAFCHRCKWNSNVRGLAKAVGATVTMEAIAHRHARKRINLFEIWLSGLHIEVAREYRYLGRASALAMQVLIDFPNCEAAWDALARFYHAEARLAAQLDILSFERASPWLESPAEPLSLFQKWEAANEAHR